MTNPSLEKIWSEIFNEKWGYAIFDSDGQVITYHPYLAEFLLDPSTIFLKDKSLLSIFPEFIGYEKELQDLRENESEVFTIERVFRPWLHGEVGYVDIHIKGYQGGWLVGTSDVTVRGEMEQKIVQQRNELAFLSIELEKERMKIDKLLRAFVPTTVVDDLLKQKKTTLGGTRQFVTVLFADLRGYTRWAEQRSPEEAIDGLNILLSSAVEILHQYGATINQLMGDGFMSIFNAPIEQSDHANLALESARKIAKLSGLGEQVRFGVGVNTGYAMVGNVGSLHAMDYSAIGTTTNIAYRLQQLAGPGEALFTEETKKLVGESFSNTVHGNFDVKGISTPVSVYKMTL